MSEGAEAGGRRKGAKPPGAELCRDDGITSRSVAGVGGQGRRIRILLVDDHPIVRRALAGYVSSEPGLMVCGEAEDQESALAAVATAPDLAIVDLALKNSSGLELIRNVHASHPQILIVVLSMHDDSHHVEAAIRLGARGYISKSDPADKVMDAIRQVLGGGIYLSARVAAQVASRAARSMPSRAGSALDGLSKREWEIFELIGSGVSTAQIASSLQITASTVETYRTRIKEKLNLKGSTELLQAAISWKVGRGIGGSQEPLMVNGNAGSTRR